MLIPILCTVFITLAASGFAVMQTAYKALLTAGSLFADLGEVCGYYETFYTVNASGMTVACSMPGAVGTLDISNRPWFHAAMESGDLTLSLPFRSRITGDALMAISQRFSYEGQLGLMVGSLQIRKLTISALEQENHQWQRAVVVTRDGLVAASVVDEEIGEYLYKDREWFRTAMESDSDYFEFSENSTGRIAALHQLEGTPLYAMIIADKNWLTEPVKSVERIGVITVLAALLLSWIGILLS